MFMFGRVMVITYNTCLMHHGWPGSLPEMESLTVSRILLLILHLDILAVVGRSKKFHCIYCIVKCHCCGVFGWRVLISS